MEYTLKKSLGQHFLHDADMCRRIVEALEAPSGRVLEIGPGGGAITRFLLERGFADYRCVELDEEKIHYLLKHYPTLQDRILHRDFLQMEKPFEEAFAVIGNFPYNISSQIMFRLLDWGEAVEEVVGMFQKEVAQRIASPHGNRAYGILSVLTQAFYQVDYLFDVQASCFTPPPKVLSGVIRLTPLGNPYGITDANAFRKLVKAAFSQRRKTLRNSLKSYLPSDFLAHERFGLRAEQLSVQAFAELFHQTRALRR